MAETDDETIVDLARIIMVELVAASRVAPAEECLPYFDKTVKKIQAIQVSLKLMEKQSCHMFHSKVLAQ